MTTNQGAIFIKSFSEQLIREKVTMYEPDDNNFYEQDYDNPDRLYFDSDSRNKALKRYQYHLASRRTFPYDVKEEHDGKEIPESDFEINQENQKAYPLKEALRRENFPHLVGMENRINAIRFGTIEYWKERCRFLEKTIDETYSTFERDNCRHFYLILVKKEK